MKTESDPRRRARDRVLLLLKTKGEQPSALLSERLGITPEESTEIETFEWPGKRRHFPVGPAWVPWASQEVQLPTPSMPTRYSMAVFDLAIWSLRQ